MKPSAKPASYLPLHRNKSAVYATLLGMHKILRIGSGKYRGRKLVAPHSSITRPVTGYCKKVLFDTSQPFLQHAAVLDLFAGSGALGLEALSRGAATATFIEQHPQALKCIQKNIATLKCQSQCTVYQNDGMQYLKAAPSQYSCIFIDPPYAIAAEICPPLLQHLDQQYSQRACHIWISCEVEAAEALRQMPLQHLHLKCIIKHVQTRLLLFTSS